MLCRPVLISSCRIDVGWLLLKDHLIAGVRAVGRNSSRGELETDVDPECGYFRRSTEFFQSFLLDLSDPFARDV